MPRALVIGHLGQDGSYLWEQLSGRGITLAGVSRNETAGLDPGTGRPIDIRDASAVAALVERFSPDFIYYLAAHHHSSQDSGAGENEAWQDSWDVHMNAFANVLRAARQFRPDTRIFYASSSRIFGDAIVSPQAETTEVQPTCIYGVTKAAAMVLARYYRLAHGMHVSSGILFNHESPRRGPQFVSQRVVNGLVGLKLGEIDAFEVGSLEARVDWGYAPDYTRAMQAIVESGQPGDYVIATGRAHSVREMIEVAAAHLGLAWEGRVIETAHLLRRNPLELRGDASKLRRMTGWQPSVDFAGMVRILVDAAMANRRRWTATALSRPRNGSI